MVLFDTDVVSDFSKPRPHPRLRDWVEALPPDEIAISVVTVFEIQLGIENLRARHPDKARQYEDWLEDILDAGFAQVIPLDIDIARLQAKMYRTPALRNFLVGDPRSKKLKTGADLVIAATAIMHRATIASLNASDFLEIDRHFPLPGLFDPAKGKYVIEPSGDHAGRP